MYVKIQLLIVYVATAALVLADYWKERDILIKQEESLMIGSSIILNEKEQIANNILMGYKLNEYDAGFENPGIFAPGRHFFDVRKDIENSNVFKFIKRIPKGAALHSHDTALVSSEYLYNLTYEDNLYACTVDDRLKLKFLLHADQDKSCNWTLISILRNQDPDYDEWVRSQLTLYVDNPRKQYPHINAVWKVMNDLFDTVTPLLTYRPIFQKHFYQALEEIYEDNVRYMEFRGRLSTVYELNGTTYNPVEILGLYQEVIEQFEKDHPDFLGARFIYAPFRKVDNVTVENYVESVTALKKAHPDVLAGFHMVGQEDMGRPLYHFIEQLKKIPRDINFFFHSAETNWYGATTDLNLVDAILLGTKRIGHGYGLVKHPLIMKIVKERQIAIEVCPVSNQVLTLVDDMRNHPAAYLISQNYPVVISNDDPSFWGTKGLSYDFYMAFMGIASRSADLKLLKQLAKNSLLYSAMPAVEKTSALEEWEKHWDQVIDEIIGEVKMRSAIR